MGIIYQGCFVCCQIVEPSQGDSGEVIAIIPIKVSVRAIFSRFKISPSHDLNFGPICSGARKQKVFTIDNTGEFDFTYTISRPSVKDELPIEKKSTRSHLNFVFYFFSNASFVSGVKKEAPRQKRRGLVTLLCRAKPL